MQAGSEKMTLTAEKGVRVVVIDRLKFIESTILHIHLFYSLC